MDGPLEATCMCMERGSSSSGPVGEGWGLWRQSATVLIWDSTRTFRVTFADRGCACARVVFVRAEDCVKNAGGDITPCQFYMDALTACKKMSA
mmetsp:Transcript_23289/g.57469  ORF Transcript_23289/g.57469 Transcript_23289/m.57469 type:complete len:93 (-) Transcript_23289:390-668(-)